MSPETRVSELARLVERRARLRVVLSLTKAFGFYSAGRFGVLAYPGTRDKISKIEDQLVAVEQEISIVAEGLAT